MTTNNWQLKQPIDAILFDCDGTLSSIEGIDELAAANGVGEIVKKLTDSAMNKSGMNIELYQERLNLVRPTQSQIDALSEQYLQNLVPDADATIQLLTRLQKAIYLVSAGLYPTILQLGNSLRIPQENIYAVNIMFDDQGNYAGFDESTPLVQKNGKREIALQLKKMHPQIVHIGDGINDLEVSDVVTRFIGYGGVFYRENIAAQCQFYIKARSLASILPLILTQAEVDTLSPNEIKLYQQGLKTIQC